MNISQIDKMKSNSDFIQKTRQLLTKICINDMINKNYYGGNEK